jgi:hypothetical protein
MSIIAELYEKYKKTDDTVKVLHGEKFYKAISVEKYDMTGIGPVINIVLPYCMFNGSAARIIENESGKSFKLYGPVFLRFRNEIPEWYFECGSFMIKESDYDSPLNEIGQYFIAR